MFKGFPEIIVTLNKLLESREFKDRAFADVHQDLNIPVPDPIVLNSDKDLPPAKKTKYDNSISNEGPKSIGSKVLALPLGTVPTNKHIVEMVELVKPHIRKLVEDSNLVRLFPTVFIIISIQTII